MTYTCADCGCTKTEAVAATGHDFGDWICVDKEQHAKTCANGCGETVYEDHAMVDGACDGCEYAILSGDVNGDGVISLNDITLLRSYLANYDYDAGASTVEIEASADADGNGDVNLIDLILITQYLANYDYETGISSVVLG